MTNDRDDRRNVGRKDVKSGGFVRQAIYAAGGGLALVALATAAVQLEIVPRWLIGAGSEIEETAAATEPGDLFTPPSPETIPDSPFGDAVRRGEGIFTNTATNAGDHVGNGLSCSNCHLDAGRHPNSAPMWAAWVTYPKYRAKNDQINTMEDRVMGCFNYSMNAQYSPSGTAPPVGDDIYRDLQSYFFWMATNAPTNVALDGIGFGKVEKPEGGYDLARGAGVYQAKCSVCHGDDGQGQRDLNGDYTFPPLWGADSFNWGAGMSRIDTAAAFIKNNMPLSQPGSLTDQEAWDVAAFVDSHERPKDPRQTGTIEENRLANHDGDEILYGRIVDGMLLGQGTGPSEARAATMRQSPAE